MGTRGLVGFVIDGEVKATYNHFDSYPSGLGNDVITFVKAIYPDALGSTRNLAQALKLVSNGANDENYQALRHLQGDLLGYLHEGRMVDAKDFAADSLFCEYGYLVNLDTEELEFYVGFQESPGNGRFQAQHKPGEDYHPITLAATYPFASLPGASALEQRATELENV